jgi:quinoprotein glucose dehydrogenase
MKGGARAGCRWLATLTAGLLACSEPPPPINFTGPVAGWAAWGGDPGAGRYSPLTQITPQNVGRLEQAWMHRSGDVLPKGEGKTAHQATPILDEDTLYYCTPLNRIFALDAETGAERWVFDPGLERKESWSRRCRGVSLWRDPEAATDAVCARRIFSSTMDARLFALDAGTGERCMRFGDGGEVDLRLGLGPHEPREYEPTSLPTVVGDVVAVGASVADGRRLDVPGGVIRGYDARTGALRWAFDPIPPDSPGWSPPPAAPDGTPRYYPGTPNAWGVFSVDPARDLLFLPMGNPSPDFYRGEGTRPDLDHFGSAVVALRGETGEVAWRFKTVHHDLWDYDLAAPPALVELRRAGKTIPAVAQATKSGFLFLLHRETGEPVYEVEERPVPRESVPEESLSPTQPFPTHPPPLHPTTLGPEDAFGLTPIDRAWCRRRIESLRSEGIYTPPSLEGSIQFPGVAGGFNWGGLAFDPERQIAVLNMTRMPNVIRLVPRARADELVRDPPRRIVFEQAGTPYALEQGVLISPLGIPCSSPPWGTLLAVDLERGETLWEVPFGTTRGFAPWPFWIPFGMPSMGGPLVTASGLVFIGAAMDGYLRAYDVESGVELFRTHLPAGGQAGPMTYRLRPEGRQFVVIAAGGHGTLGTEIGDHLIAFALPD